MELPSIICIGVLINVCRVKIIFFTSGSYFFKLLTITNLFQFNQFAYLQSKIIIFPHILPGTEWQHNYRIVSLDVP